MRAADRERGGPHRQCRNSRTSQNRKIRTSTRFAKTVTAIEIHPTNPSCSLQYTAAAKTSTLEPTAKAMASLSSSFKSDAKLSSILMAPTLSASDKSGIISELLKTASINASSKEGATVKNFLETLAENNRLNQLEGAAEKFGELMSASRGEVELKVTSAQPLDQKVLKQLEGAVGKSRFVGQGKKLKVVTKVSFVLRMRRGT